MAPNSRTYSEAQLQAALDAVREKKLSQRGAAKKFGIPYTTLGEKIRGRRAVKMGGEERTVLTTAEEEQICQWLIAMEKSGFGRSKEQLCQTVKKILDDEGRETMFNSNLPGRTWYYGFKRRHPELSLREPQQHGEEQTEESREAVVKWLDDFKDTIMDIDPTLLIDSDRVFNADESVFTVCPKSGRVLEMQGQRHDYAISNSNKQLITCLACVSASSNVLPPLLIFPGTNFRYNPLEGFEDAQFAKSKNGWINGAIFGEWLKNDFVPATAMLKKPVLLLIYGHASHVTHEASKTCSDNDIILYGLLPHASQLLQPLYLFFFSSLEKQWKKAVSEYRDEHMEVLSKQTFAPVFKKAWEATTSIDFIGAKSFHMAGIFPLDERNVDLSKVSVNSSSAATPLSLTDPSSTTPSCLTDPLSTTPGCLPSPSSATPRSLPAPAPTSPSHLAGPSSSTHTATPRNLPGPSSATPCCLSDPSSSIQSSAPSPLEQALEIIGGPSTMDLDNLLRVTEVCVWQHGVGGVQVYLTRYREGFDVKDDPCYSEWKDLYAKVSSASSRKQLQPKSSNICPNPAATTATPRVIKHLKLPNELSKKQRKKTKTTTLDKSLIISGSAYQTLLEEKAKNKAVEKQNKERKKMKKDKRREEKELEMQGKTKEIDVEGRKRWWEEGKRVNAEKKLEKPRRKRPKVTVTGSETDICCGCGSDSDGDRWVRCDLCERWWHVVCVKSMDLDVMTDDELDDIEFECDSCIFEC